MDSKSRKRRLDPTRDGEVRPEPSTTFKRKRIGVLGKAVLNDHEKHQITRLGRCLAVLGHTTQVVPAKGVADKVREGVEAQGGRIELLESGVIDVSDHTFVYADPRLLGRLRTHYPDLEDNDKVTVIRADQLDEWIAAVETVMQEKGLTPP